MRIPGPTDLFKAAGQGYDALEQAIALVPKAATLLADATSLIGRAGSLLDRADAMVGRVDSLLVGVGDTAARAGRLVSELEPTLTKLQPTLETLADTTSPQEVTALVSVVDLLPELAARLKQDILPILGTLESVAPDLRTLLLLSKELTEMLSSIPGLGRAKRKFEDDQEDGALDPDNPAGLPATAIITESDPPAGTS